MLAIRLLGTFEIKFNKKALRETRGIAFTQIEQDHLKNDRSLIHKQLESEVFQAAWAEEQTMTMEQAAEFALREIKP